MRPDTRDVRALRRALAAMEHERDAWRKEALAARRDSLADALADVTTSPVAHALRVLSQARTGRLVRPMSHPEC